jgi:hypothetical protein
LVLKKQKINLQFKNPLTLHNFCHYLNQPLTVPILGGPVDILWALLIKDCLHSGKNNAKLAGFKKAKSFFCSLKPSTLVQFWQ